MKKENIYNIPNFLTALRIVMTFVIIYMIFLGTKLSTIAILFILAMITDCLDGQIARGFNLKTKFGAKFDMIADRLLMIGTVLALIIYSIFSNHVYSLQIKEIFMIISREIISFPVFLIALLLKKKFIAKARIIGKSVTVLQALAFPSILFNFNFSVYLSAITMIVGFFSGLAYLYDVIRINKK